MIIIQNLILIFSMNMISRCSSATHKINASALDDEKKSLRYGFHRTQDCLNFELAFLCIRKCLDLGFDVAHADKECLCTCFYNRAKGQHNINKNSLITKWRLGAPTTKHPAWILPNLPKEEILHEEVDLEQSEEVKHDDLNPEDHNENLNSDDKAKGTADKMGSANGTADNNIEESTADGNGTVGDKGDVADKGAADEKGDVDDKGTADDNAAAVNDGTTADDGAAADNNAPEDNGGAAE